MKRHAPAPFFYLLPGFGFGIERDGKSEAYRADVSLVELKKIAVQASRMICGIDEPNELVLGADHPTKLFALWLQGGQVADEFPRVAFRPGKPHIPLDFKSLESGTDGLRHRHRPTSRKRLLATLTSMGCKVFSDEIPEGHHPVRFLPFCRHPYVSSNRHGVIGEGKGINPAHGEMGALCEGIERVLAMRPNYSSSYVGNSASSLCQQGIAVPRIEAGSRDCYSDELLLDWVQARCFPDIAAALPAELVWFHYVPQSGFRAFDMRHTVGLAAGDTEAEAFSNGLLECIERDAYALLMRCRLSCPEVSPTDIAACGKDVTELLAKLEAEDIDVHMKWIRLDYHLPIAHVLLHDRRDRIPAHSHGCSAALTPSHAIARALFEAVQMHHGLSRFAAIHWENMAARIETCHSHPRYAWGDPLYSPTLTHLFNRPKTAATVWRQQSLTMQHVCEFLQKRGRRIFWTTLGKAAGLTVVRVFVEGSVSPDSRQEDRSQRLARWVRRCKLPGPYTDPILT